MQGREIDKSRMTMRDDHTRIREIESWFRYEYVDRLYRIERIRMIQGLYFRTALLRFI